MKNNFYKMIEKQFWFYLITKSSSSSELDLSFIIKDIPRDSEKNLLYVGLKRCGVFDCILNNYIFTSEYLIVSSEEITMWDNKKICCGFKDTRPIILDFEKASLMVRKVSMGISPNYPGRPKLSFEWNYPRVVMEGIWFPWIEGVNKALENNHDKDSVIGRISDINVF
jgi:hypothetical protein